MKKVFLIFALLLCFTLLSPAALALVSQSSSFYVADAANVLSPATEQLVIDYNGALEQQCQGAQFVVVTVTSLEGMNADEYANALLTGWGVGGLNSGLSNGTLLLLSPSEKRGWLAVGNDLTSALSESTVNDMLDTYFWPSSDAGNYDQAVTDFTYQLMGWYDGYYGSNVLYSNPNYPGAASNTAAPNYSTPAKTQPNYGGGYWYDSSYGGGGSVVFGLVSFVVIAVVFIVILSAIFGRGRQRGAWRGYGYYGRPTIFPVFFGSPFWGWGRRPPPPFPHDPRGQQPPRGSGYYGGGGFGNGAGHGGGGGFGGSFGGGGFGGGAGHGGGGFGGGGGGGRR